MKLKCCVHCITNQRGNIREMKLNYGSLRGINAHQVTYNDVRRIDVRATSKI